MYVELVYFTLRDCLRVLRDESESGDVETNIMLVDTLIRRIDHVNEDASVSI